VNIDVPRHWAAALLDDVADIRLGKMLDKGRPKGSPHKYLRNINIRWDAIDTSDLSSMSFEDDELERFGIRNGDVLVCEGGEPGRAAVWNLGDTDLKYQKALHRIRLPASIAARWVMYQLMLDTWSGRLARSFTGSTIAHLPREKLANYELRLAPTQEQQRVVDAIDSYLTRLDDAVASLERVQDKLKAYRASVLKAAVEGRLVPTEASLARAERREYEPADVLLERILRERRSRWEEAELGKLKAAGKTPKDDKWKAKYQEPATPDTSTLPGLPEGWCWTSLSALLSEPLRNGHSARQTNDSGGLRTLTLSAVTEGDFGLHNTKLTVADPATVSDLWLLPGDILVERSNTPELVGTAAMFRGNADFAIFPDLLVRVRCTNLVSGDYIEMVLSTPRARAHFQAAAQGIAGTMPKISQGTIETLPIPLPPAPELGRLVLEVQRLLSVETVLLNQVALDQMRCSRLRQSILKWAFEGRLVDQDPTDEPADQLLARIRAERAAAAPSTTKNRGRKAKGAA
jgi:type I restriction enzyme S subunit